MPDRAAEPVSSFVIDGVDAIPARLRGAVVAIGNFDGMHRAHQKLLNEALTAARAAGVPSVVMTFEPHPRILFQPDTPLFRLTPREAKARIAKALGFDAMIVIAFDPQFSAISAGDFVRSILVERLAISAVVVGYNFRFGAGRGGSAEYLTAAGERNGFKVIVVPPVTEVDGARISSGLVRDFLAAGDVTRANALLGYRWFVSGQVVRGDRRGRALGFPTANVRLAPEAALRFGIYAVTVARANGEAFNGVASFGRRPTFDPGEPVLEAFLFDFEGDLYDETITVTFVDWIRPEEKFADADALAARMKLDADEARAILASAPPGSDLDRRLAVET
jgi:riboflavin kinase/FMN adenylyltransferase